MKRKITRVSAVVLWLMGGFLVLVGLFLGKWGRAAQGALFMALGVYFTEMYFFDKTLRSRVWSGLRERLVSFFGRRHHLLSQLLSEPHQQNRLAFLRGRGIIRLASGRGAAR